MDFRIPKAVLTKMGRTPGWNEDGEWWGKFNRARRRRFTRMWEEDPRCHYCGVETILDGKRKGNSATCDHKVALSRRGTEHPSNYLLSCYRCNNIKSNRKYDDFIVYMKTKEFKEKYNREVSNNRIRRLKRAVRQKEVNEAINSQIETGKFDEKYTRLFLRVALLFKLLGLTSIQSKDYIDACVKEGNNNAPIRSENRKCCIS